MPVACCLGSVPSHRVRRISDSRCQVEGLESCRVNVVVFVPSKPFIKGKVSAPRNRES